MQTTDVLALVAAGVFTAILALLVVARFSTIRRRRRLRDESAPGYAGPWALHHRAGRKPAERKADARRP